MRKTAWALVSFAAVACSEGPEDASPAEEYRPAAVKTGAPVASEVPAWPKTTGDDVADAMIARIEANPELGNPFSIHRLVDGVPQIDSEYSSPEWLAFVGNQYRREVPAAIRRRIAVRGEVRLMVHEDCGFNAIDALGVPESYFSDEDRISGRFAGAQIFVAARAAGLRPIPFQDLEFRYDFDLGLLPSLQGINERLAGAQPDDGRPPVAIIDVTDGCGAGELAVAIETVPPGGQVRLIPEFFFALCKSRGKNPWSPEQCRWWRDAVDGSTEMVAGTYRYSAQADGRERTGRIAVTNEQLDGLFDTGEVLKIRM